MNIHPTRLALAAATLSLVLAGCGGDSADPLLVQTEAGTVKGVAGATQYQYLGIPYAAPPVGPLRWKAPAAAVPWTGTRDASKPGSGCVSSGLYFGVPSTHEDCLTLNIYRPKGDGPYPVLVFIHGGALIDGFGAQYDPERLVAQGLVVVTLNYRLGALGFLSHPALSAESGGKGSGNYGFMDQQMALRWVRSNIAQFGGDARNVTISGQSGGALSVNTLLASPLSAGLFDKAIAMSGGYSIHGVSQAKAHQNGQAFAIEAGCTDQTAECLRKLTPAQINKLRGHGGDPISGGTPVIDNHVVTLSIKDAFAQGRIQRVPVMAGSTGNEFSLISTALIDFNPAIGPVTPANYAAALAFTVAGSFDPTAATPAQADAAFAGITNLADRIDAIGTARTYSCPTEALNRSLAAHVPVYAYEFNDPDAPEYIFPPFLRAKWGASHAADLAYLFKILPVNSAIDGKPILMPAFTANQERLAREMAAAWAQFARTGDPNPAGKTDWPRYGTTGGSTWSFEPAVSVADKTFATRHRCSIW
ncbi:MAG: carboxylesterase family protein [Burkholderiales bacterium]|nr:carboxylesterase family protein [Burkholderiales bacterium]